MAERGMTRHLADLPEAAVGGEGMEEEASFLTQHLDLKKRGLNISDVARLAAALRGGMSWADVKSGPGSSFHDTTLEGWRADLERRAGLGGGPVMPPGAGAAPAKPAAPAVAPVAAVAAEPVKKRTVKRASKGKVAHGS